MQWIRVEDGLPDTYEYVIVYDEKEVSTAYWDGARWVVCWYTEEAEIKNVTHWMPLPEAPKEW